YAIYNIHLRYTLRLYMRKFSNLTWHLQKIPHFYTAAKYGSIRLAAKHLMISQPSLSKSIQSLEEICSVKLFLRGRGGVRLTAEGKILFQFSESLLKATDDVSHSLGDENAKNLPIRFATHELFVPRIFPHLQVGLNQQDSSIKYSLITETSSSAMIRKIMDSEVDIGLVVEGQPTKLVQRHKLATDSYQCFASRTFIKKHKIKPTKPLGLDELVDGFPFIFAPDVTATSTKTIDQCLSLTNIDLSSAYKVTSIESVSALVNGHLGIGLLPNRFSQHLRNSDIESIKVNFGDNKNTFGALTLYAYFGESMLKRRKHLDLILKMTSKILE
ncbi:MAG: LysR family transcriptional regulator, partial [Proteobacteria bacterium]|nr:LysR family transcriptional regulator [Pseudomonadota bacterium]